MNSIKSFTPPFVKQPIRRGLNLGQFLAGKRAVPSYRALTCLIRVMPNFIIIGGQKCGTTSLYRYLEQHPNIVSALHKEPNFFSMNFGQGLSWYKAHFPLSVYMYYSKKIRGQSLITGEASPYYIYYPHTPRRISQILPQAKLILLLRNPVDRAYSHYNHKVRRGIEPLPSFEDAIVSEAERLAGEGQKVVENQIHFSFNHLHYSYLARGIYIEQLEAWMRYFPREQMLIIKSEDFRRNEKATLRKVFEFLNLSYWEFREYKMHNSFRYPEMNPVTRKKLTDYFEPYNKRLYEYLGINFDWESDKL